MFRVHRLPEDILCNPVAEEKAAGFDGSTGKWSTDTTIKAREAVGADRLAETVQRASVLSMTLGLKPDFDGIEGIFNAFPNNSGELKLVREDSRDRSRTTHGTKGDIFEGLKRLALWSYQTEATRFMFGQRDLLLGGILHERCTIGFQVAGYKV